MKINENITMLEIPTPFGTHYPTLINHSGGLTLIDTTYTAQAETLIQAISDAEYNAGDVLAGLIEKRNGPPGEKPPDKNEKVKLYNYLLNKGFTYDEINSAYNKFYFL